MRMQRGGGEPGLGDPVLAYKVYVEDGREELIRGVEFAPVSSTVRKAFHSDNWPITWGDNNWRPPGRSPLCPRTS